MWAQNLKESQNTNSTNKYDPIKPRLKLPKNLLQREEEHKEIDTKFLKLEVEAPNLIAAVILWNIGGSGKTTLAHSFAQALHADLIWKFKARNEDNLYKSLSLLAMRIAAQQGNRDFEKEIKSKLENEKSIKNRKLFQELSLLPFVQDYMKEHPGWVLIFDDVKNVRDISKYLPNEVNFWGKGRILITTQNQNIFTYLKNENLQIDTFQVPSLKDGEALSLFQTCLYGEDKLLAKNSKIVDLNFVQNLIPFPLDIKTVAYFLKSTQRTDRNHILANLKKGTSSFQKTFNSFYKENISCEKTRFKLMSMEVKDILNADKNIAGLLMFACYLEPHKISSSLLEKYLENAKLETALLYTLEQQLNKFSLLEGGMSYEASIKNLQLPFKNFSLNFNISFDIISSGDNVGEWHPQTIIERTYRFHPSIQEALRNCLKNLILQKPQGAQETYKNIINTMAKSIVPSVHIDSINRFEIINFIGHAETFLQNIINDSIESFDIAELFRHLSLSYNEIGNHECASNYWDKAYQIYDSMKLENNKIWSLMYQLKGNICYYSHKLSEAIEMYEESLRFNRKNYKEGNIQKSQLLLTLNNLGALYLVQYISKPNNNISILTKSDECLQEVVKDLRSLEINREYSSIAELYNNLACLKMYQECFDEALNFIQDSINTYKSHCSKDGVKLAEIYITAAEIAYKKHDFSESSEFLQKAQELFGASPKIYLYYKHLAKHYLQKIQFQFNHSNTACIPNDLKQVKENFKKYQSTFTSLSNKNFQEENEITIAIEQIEIKLKELKKDKL
jgi:tetratricopeptide (TPR) repeat protein